jgi:hypothetical protein
MDNVGVRVVTKSWSLSLVKKILSVYSSPRVKADLTANAASAGSEQRGPTIEMTINIQLFHVLE